MVNQTPPPTQPIDTMAFADRLAAARKHHNLTQQALAERANIHVTQIRRYEAGSSAPTLDALRNLAIALNATADSLIFEPDERGPTDDLHLQFEATQHLDPDEQQLVRSLIEAILLRHDTRRWNNAS